MVQAPLLAGSKGGPCTSRPSSSEKFIIHHHSCLAPCSDLPAATVNCKQSTKAPPPIASLNSTSPNQLNHTLTTTTTTTDTTTSPRPRNNKTPLSLTRNISSFFLFPAHTAPTHTETEQRKDVPHRRPPHRHRRRPAHRCPCCCPCLFRDLETKLGRRRQEADVDDPCCVEDWCCCCQDVCERRRAGQG